MTLQSVSSNGDMLQNYSTTSHLGYGQQYSQNRTHFHHRRTLRILLEENSSHSYWQLVGWAVSRGVSQGGQARKSSGSLSADGQPHPLSYASSQLLATANLFSISTILSFQECYICGIMPYVTFGDWLSSLSIILQRFFQVVLCISI